MGDDGRAAGPDRALQARNLQSGDRCLQKPGMKKNPVLMIHGAFCGPWSLDGLKEKFNPQIVNTLFVIELQNIFEF